MGCEAEDFAAFMPLVFRLRNIAAALITMPYKVAAVDLLEKASKAIAIYGACNAVKRGEDGQLIGDIFDGEGFVRGMIRGDEPQTALLRCSLDAAVSVRP